jgi:UDP-glucuronate decarboxylase
MRRNGAALVAGGAGFLGSAVCTRLLAQGRSVIALDDFSTGTREAIAPLLDHPAFRLIRADARNPPDIEAAEIWNFACPADPTVWPRDPGFVLTSAVVGTQQLLALATRQGARFIQASTSEVYGDPEVHPQPETYVGRVDCTGARAAYEEGKRAAETLCAIAQDEGADVRVARLFNAYGPGMREDDGRAVPAFIRAALIGRPLMLFGDGSQTRSFCFVDDMLDGLFALMALPAAPDGPVNLGATEEVSLLALASLVRRIAGSASPVVHAPGRPDDPRRRRPDLTRAGALLGFAPRVDLAEGLARTIRARAAQPAAAGC